jgi:membrane protease YdiL (CAAX protease family)
LLSTLKTCFHLFVVNLSSFPPDFALIFFSLAIVVPWRGTVRIRRLLNRPELTSNERLSLYASTITFQWLLFAIVFWRAFARGFSPAELGLSLATPERTIFATITLTGVLCANQWAGLRALARMPPEKRGFMARFTQLIMPRNGTEASLFSALACTAGISEEFLFRGFVFIVLVHVLGNTPFPAGLALFLSSILFAIAHLYQGSRGIITTLIVGILFCLVRIWTGNLISPIVAHMGIDLFAGLYARRVLFPGPELAAGQNTAT